jgi:two-component system sensor histidine kinase TctE
MARESQHSQRSVFGEIVDWTLAPLLILWPVSMAIQYFFAYSIADGAYDRELRDSVHAVSKQLSYDAGQLVVNDAAAAAVILRADDDDLTFYQVRDRRNALAGGEAALSPVDFTPEMEPHKVYFRDDRIPGHELRVAYTFAQVPGMSGAALVQVGETVRKRSRLASEIIGDVLAAQFLIVPVALLFVWLGLTRGVAPLNDLTAAIRGRRPGDLAPIDEAGAPEEVRPLLGAFNELLVRLDASLRAQQRFVADAAHQMRTPLAGLKMQAEIAMRQRDPVNLQHAMRQIVASADRTAHLINQLLALARADSDAPPALRPLDLDSLARDVAREWVARAQEKDIDLGFEATGAPAWVDGNVALLRELLANLVDNAIRYTPAGGRVTVRVAADDGVLLEIEDTGIGIPEADRELVFERFYRVLGTGAEGSGLGLPIVRGIAHLHGASVALAPNPHEHGTLARVAFPRSNDTPERLRPAA